MKTYQNILIVVYILLFFSNAAMYLPEVKIITLQPFHLVLCMAFFSIPLLFNFKKTIVILIRNKVFLWIICYILISAISYTYSKASAETSFQQIKNVLLLSLILFIGVILFESEKAILVQNLILFCTTIGVILNIYELFNPLSFSFNLGRSAGMYMNSNVSALALLVGLVFSISMVKGLWKGPFIGFVGFGVLTTFSRAGMLTYLLIVFMLYVYKKFNLISLIVFLLIIYSLFFSFDIFGINDILGTDEMSLMIDRINVFGNGTVTNDDSSYERKRLLEMGIEKYLDNPIFGAGLGAAYEISGAAYSSQSTHNQFVYLLIEYGIFGVFLMFFLFFILAQNYFFLKKSFEISTFLLVYFTNCFFSHNMFDNFFLLIIISFIPKYREKRYVLALTN